MFLHLISLIPVTKRSLLLLLYCILSGYVAYHNVEKHIWSRYR